MVTGYITGQFCEFRCTHALYSTVVVGVNSAVRINKLNISPSTIVMPGRVDFDVDIDILREIKSTRMSVKLTRNTFLVDLTLPCVDNIGSW